MPFLFLRGDYQKLAAKREQMHEKYRDAAKTTGDSHAKGKIDNEDSGNAEAMREMNLVGQRLAELDGVLREAQIIQGPQSDSLVAIGHVACVLEIESGKKVWYALGSYIINGNDPSLEPEDGSKEHPYNVSYFSPIGRFINGKALMQEFDLRLPMQKKAHRMRIAEIVRIAQPAIA